MSSIIVFGASRGIGRIIAGYLIKKGHEVSAAGRDLRELRKFKHGIIRHGLNVNIVRADITRESDVVRVFKSHTSQWHSSPDAVINCAAVQGPIGNSWSSPSKRWQETVAVNLVGSFLVARAAVRRMIKRGYGSVILFSGGGAAYARPHFSAYGASKTGVVRMVETIAEELKLAGHGNIIINAVAPGAVKTRMTDEVMKSGQRAGEQALKEAARVFKTGGTPGERITGLIDFLIDVKRNKCLNGRLIHVHDDYAGVVKKFGTRVPREFGKLRRITEV